MYDIHMIKLPLRIKGFRWHLTSLECTIISDVGRQRGVGSNVCFGRYYGGIIPISFLGNPASVITKLIAITMATHVKWYVAIVVIIAQDRSAKQVCWTVNMILVNAEVSVCIRILAMLWSEAENYQKPIIMAFQNVKTSLSANDWPSVWSLSNEGNARSFAHIFSDRYEEWQLRHGISPALIIHGIEDMADNSVAGVSGSVKQINALVCFHITRSRVGRGSGLKRNGLGIHWAGVRAVISSSGISISRQFTMPQFHRALDLPGWFTAGSILDVALGTSKRTANAMFFSLIVESSNVI